jgi:hypothetical protein
MVIFPKRVGKLATSAAGTAERAFAVLRKESSLQEILAGLSSLAFWRSAKLMETGMAVPWSGALLSSESGNGESKKTASHVLVPLPVDLHAT